MKWRCSSPTPGSIWVLFVLAAVAFASETSALGVLGERAKRRFEHLKSARPRAELVAIVGGGKSSLLFELAQRLPGLVMT
jgi:hypothetical protein